MLCRKQADIDAVESVGEWTKTSGGQLMMLNLGIDFKCAACLKMLVAEDSVYVHRDTIVHEACSKVGEFLCWEAGELLHDKNKALEQAEAFAASLPPIDPIADTEVKISKKAKSAPKVNITETAEQKAEAQQRHERLVEIAASHLESSRQGASSFQIRYEPRSHNNSWSCALHQMQLRITLPDGSKHNKAFGFDGTNDDTFEENLLKAKQQAVKYYHDKLQEQ